MVEMRGMNIRSAFKRTMKYPIAKVVTIINLGNKHISVYVTKEILLIQGPTKYVINNQSENN